ncbi:MAG: SDR family oxidoreductase [Pseudomonadota bacterium]|nr:SDR family oxidoreductase [Pseudomonadota bacterium]
MKSANPKTKYPKPGKNEDPQEFPGSEESMNAKPDYGRDTYKGSGKLNGKTALITGGDSGIGRAVAVAFAKEGADVLISYLPEEEEDARVTIAAIEACGRNAFAVPGDLGDEKWCDKLIRTAVDELGHIDILVNNAALQMHFESIDKIAPQDFAEIYRVNVIAPFLLAKAAVKHMKPGSAIINTASVEAYDPTQTILPYSVSKAALVALTKGLAKELLEKGIRVNAVAPGPIWTPLNTHGSPPEELKKFGEDAPLGRPGQPVELAPIYVLLASNDGSYITGEVYGVTGGSGIA